MQGDGPRGRRTADLHLATGHQRHYSILYANAMDTIQRGMLGDLHYIRAQWHRSNLPGKDQLAAAPAARRPSRRTVLAKELIKQLTDAAEQLAKASGAAIDLWRSRVAQVEAQIADEILGDDGKTPAENFGYQGTQIKDAAGKVVYQGPAIEELIRWRLWDRTGRRPDGRVGQPPVGRGEHLHFGDARRREAAPARTWSRRPTARCSPPTATWRTTSSA